MSFLFHSSIEGAQHGTKTLAQFLDFAKASGAAGAQPSNFMLGQPDGSLKPAAEIRDAFESRGLLLDGISTHCPFWVHTTAWTGSPTIRPFLPADVAKRSAAEIEQWAEDYILKIYDLAGELGVKILPMFWGIAFGWELASGYPWGFWSGADYDLLKEGKERFVTRTARLRDEARKRGLYLCHEIHPGTAASTADDFNLLVSICDGDPVLAVNSDPSHCWEGEGWETRTLKVASRIYAAHVKNHTIRPGFPLRGMEADWTRRGMQFTDLPYGDINLHRYAEVLIQSGYAERYRRVMGRESAPLVVEAESAYRDLDQTSARGIAFVRDELCYPVAAGSFEDGMGA